jgi:hypothetical protein
MYSRLEVVEDAERRAEAAAFKDRMCYEKFIEAGEQFAAKHALIVCGPAATRLLLSDPEALESSPPILGLDSFQYDLFSGQAPTHARALGDAMYQLDPQGLGHYTTVMTKVTDYLLTVAVDGRDLFTVTSLPPYRGIRLVDIVNPSTRSAQFAKDGNGAPLRLLCTGPELQLIGVYMMLCNPAKAANWGELLETEAGLRGLFGQEIRAKIEAAVARVGGAARLPAAEPLYRILRDKYAAGPSRVLIGPAAIALLTGKSVVGEDRLQVITAGRLDGDAQEIVALAKAAGVEVAWKIDDPKIPTDPRLRRMTVHAVLGSRREPILDVYNSAAFDLVPYVTLASAALWPKAASDKRAGAASRRVHREKAPATSGPPATLKIGTPFVLMRYRLIDMWTLQILMQMGVINAGFAKATLNGMLSGYNAAAAHYESMLASAAHDPEGASHQLMPLTAYIGRLEDPELALKRAAQSRKGARFHPPYLPASRNRTDGSDAATGNSPAEDAATGNPPAEGAATGGGNDY